MKIELVTEAASDSCEACKSKKAKHERLANKHKQNAMLASDRDQKTMFTNNARFEMKLANEGCDKCRAVNENYYNPRNVVANDRTAGASTDDTVYSDIKAKRPYEPAPNDAVDTEQDQKVNVPSSLIKLLDSRAKDAKAYSDKINVTQSEDKQFYLDLAQMFEDLNQYLKSGSVYDIKMANVFMTSLMGPMLYEIPTEVVRFISYGGTHTPLKSFMNSISVPQGGIDMYSQTQNKSK